MRKLEQATRYSLNGRRKLLTTLSGAVLFYLFMVLFSFPTYSYQMISSSPALLPEAVMALSNNLVASAGITGFILTIIYSAVAGISLTVVISSMSTTGAGTITPGLIASGCASCGTGLLGLIGLGGVVASMPFEGNLVRLGGIGLIVFYLNKTGNPEICEVD